MLRTFYGATRVNKRWSIPKRTKRGPVLQKASAKRMTSGRKRQMHRLVTGRSRREPSWTCWESCKTARTLCSARRTSRKYPSLWTSTTSPRNQPSLTLEVALANPCSMQACKLSAAPEVSRSFPPEWSHQWPWNMSLSQSVMPKKQSLATRKAKAHQLRYTLIRKCSLPPHNWLIKPRLKLNKVLKAGNSTLNLTDRPWELLKRMAITMFWEKAPTAQAWSTLSTQTHPHHR